MPVCIGELVDLHLAVPGLVDIAVPGDVDPQLPILNGVSALVAQGGVDGLTGQIHQLAVVQCKGALQPSARAVLPGVDLHLNALENVIALNVDLPPVEPDEGLHVNDKRNQRKNEKDDAEPLQLVLVDHFRGSSYFTS